MKIKYLFVFFIFCHSFLKGQENNTMAVKGDTVIHFYRLKDSVQAPSYFNKDTISFNEIKNLFINCMNKVPKRVDYKLFISFSFDINESGNIDSISVFEFSKTLSQKLSTFKKEKLLFYLPKKWNSAIIRNNQKPIKFKVDVLCLFNHEYMDISMEDINGHLLFSKVQLKR